MKGMLSIGALLMALAQPAMAQTAPAPTAPAAAPPAVVAPAPDYNNDAAWLCLPGRKDACAVDQDVTVITAAGKRKIVRFKTDPNSQFDCFYVYPTVSLDPTPNSDLKIGPEERNVAAAQAARFSAKCRVYAPLYRQVTLTALRDVMMGKATAADRKLAYADVAAAWRTYREKYQSARGVVLIGHSQGAGILKQLLADVIENDPDQRRLLIAAYLLGTNVAVPQGADVGGDFKRTRLCRAMDQYDCVVSYVTFRADSPPPPNSRFGKVPQPGMVAACVNPAALGGGKAETDAIFGAKGAGLASAPQGPWTSDNAPVTTPFVSVPGLITAECASNDGFDYLAVTVNADPRDPRTDTIVGDVMVNGVVLKDWGLHLLDMPVEMGDLVTLSDHQAAAWRGVPIKPGKR
ncbi:MAG: DUF3089 domain-containing protein [Sphingomonas sp.]|uniref:DUF3089 domain-containing protein n=1 Tax=Sphingomonas sp. TaxID=28214 RepID=UPI003F80320A